MDALARAVEARGALAAGKEPVNTAHLSLGLDADATHDVVSGRADLHGLLRNIHLRQFLELVVHPWQLLPDLVLVPP